MVFNYSSISLHVPWYSTVLKQNKNFPLNTSFIFFSPIYEGWWVFSLLKRANIRFTCSLHSLLDHLNQAGPVSHLLLLSSSKLIAGWSAWLLIPLTSFHCETLVVSNFSSTQLAANTCFLQSELFLHCNIVIDSDLSRSLNICSFNLAALTAVCNSNVAVERCPIGKTLYSSIKLMNQSFLSVVTVDRPLNTSFHQMRVQRHEIWFYPALFWSIYYLCLFEFQSKVAPST